ncbi:MAG: M23 family metallopeptidase [Drouetiella hepatica Uher 2000/2452]|jgi:murein DD-endopeptidase MepM/ murein hydrolase activator NlpD|uniref:M23 family metallopeptidase n=1 Tax=Drouetiella hepatica Uher 2000/2452 TaxID=904376 RepID=A0A951QEN7_9CYAN|nr:M23 family metallopeptidase [Drouetiella hepatica Uher 2000/2452]
MPDFTTPDFTTPEAFSESTVAPADASGAIDASPAPESFSSPDLVSPNLADDAKAAFDQATPGTYIDPTPYSLGATSPDVILSERSTGCEAVLQAGQGVPSSICPLAPSFSAESGGIDSNGGSSGSYSSTYNTAVALPSAQDFYNLTVRPPAQISNGNISLQFPLTIPAAITSAFGWRIHPIAGESRFHTGTDLGAPQGTPVMAVFDGKVQIADVMGGYGLAVVLRHNKDTQETLYAHMSEVFVKPGDTVKQGEVIGRVGSTGYSTGPHLHFEFHKLTPQGWTMVDPGQALEYSLAQFIKGIKPGDKKAESLFASIGWENLKKALEMAEAKPKAPKSVSLNPAPRLELSNDRSEQ